MSLSEPGLGREAADRALERLSAESDRIAEGLLAMDSHPGHQLLRGSALTGLTERRWAETSTAMATLWEQFDAYRTLLDQAKAVRARRARPGQEELAELTELLTGKVVELNQQQVPIEKRGLTGPALIVDKITLAELVTRMKDGYAKVTEVLAEADRAWSATLTRLDSLDRALQPLAAQAESVDPGQLSKVDEIRQRLTETRTRAVTDPLAIGPDDPLAGIQTELTEIAARLAELAATRDSVDSRLERLNAAIADIDTTLAQARTVETTVHEKVASPGLTAIPDLTTPLRARIDGLTPLRQAGNWFSLSGELSAVDREVAAARDQAAATLRARTGLLDRRQELRGRLDAYRAKAERLGLAENLDLAALHKQAYDLLYTRPTDLAAGTRAVNQYQQAVREGNP
jgi:DNA repair exonuclease SbcCD ATPase subunit